MRDREEGELRCSRGHSWRWDTPADVCPTCAGLLQWEPTRAALTPLADLAPWVRSSGVWRHGALVWPGPSAQIVSLQEGRGALHPLPPRLAATVHDTRVWLQHEGENPTASFKDRGMTVAVTAAVAQGAHTLVCASTGNTSSSVAAYAAAAGVRAVVLVPEGKISGAKLAQTLAHGAAVIAIEGTFDTCMQLTRSLAVTPLQGVRVVNSVSPWRLAGQGTIALSVLATLAQYGERPPDWIVLPGGNLGNVSALGQTLRRLHAWGQLATLPRLAVAQAAGAAPFAAWAARQWHHWAPEPAPTTIASAIRIGDPVSAERARAVVHATEGTALAVEDAAIVAAQRDLARTGLGAEPASSAVWAGIQRLVADGTIAPGSQVVGVLTGHLLKDPTPLVDPADPAPGIGVEGRLTRATPAAIHAWLAAPARR